MRWVVASVVGVVGIVDVLDEDVIDEVVVVVVVGVGCYIAVKMADQTSSVVIVVFYWVPISVWKPALSTTVSFA